MLSRKFGLFVTMPFLFNHELLSILLMNKIVKCCVSVSLAKITSEYRRYNIFVVLANLVTYKTNA